MVQDTESREHRQVSRKTGKQENVRTQVGEPREKEAALQPHGGVHEVVERPLFRGTPPPGGIKLRIASRGCVLVWPCGTRTNRATAQPRDRGGGNLPWREGRSDGEGRGDGEGDSG